jgi:hypothetical protein
MTGHQVAIYTVDWPWYALFYMWSSGPYIYCSERSIYYLNEVFHFCRQDYAVSLLWTVVYEATVVGPRVYSTVRPIAVSYVWRCLASNDACNHVMKTNATLLVPRQLGFGIAGGAEAAVRAARIYVDSMQPGQAFNDWFQKRIQHVTKRFHFGSSRQVLPRATTFRWVNYSQFTDILKCHYLMPGCPQKKYTTLSGSPVSSVESSTPGTTQIGNDQSGTGLRWSRSAIPRGRYPHTIPSDCDIRV